MTARRKASKGRTPAPEQLRCAVYCRKSTNHGLDQDFNSLDAQREAGESYIASQKAKGWLCLPDCYDDGGCTGANLDRPAMKRLLADIKAGGIDIVVVYKLDRLSRALLDFARLMGDFDAHGVRFVSVTEQLNTSTPAGRMQVRMIMSFAEFERELISERTRDKMQAARRKGKWVGGVPVLGYDIDPDGKGLVVNPDEAVQIQAIYALYLDRKSLLPTLQELARRRWTTKRWTTKAGAARGGAAFTKTALHRLLTNPIYLGKVRVDQELLPGEHDALVNEGVWKQVQRLLRSNGRTNGSTVRNRNGALLKGLLRCGSCGVAMIHSPTRKGSRQYRYYVCQRAQKEGWNSCPTKSVPAPEIERFVFEKISCVGADRGLQDLVIEQVRATQQSQSAAEIRAALAEFGPVWEALTILERARVARLLIERVEYDGEREEVEISFRPSAIAALTEGGVHEPT